MTTDTPTPPTAALLFAGELQSPLPHGRIARCGLLLYERAADNVLIAVLSDISNDTDTMSVTNAAEYHVACLRAQFCKRGQPLLVWEHYDLQREGQNARSEEWRRNKGRHTFDKVTAPLPDVNGVIPHDAEWKRGSRAQVEAMIGQRLPFEE